jgi:hypothetical protein
MISSSARAIDQEVGQLNKLRELGQLLGQHSVISAGIRIDTCAV